ncbi:hypothetical protein LOCC1_G003325 [Lachnellula occidentalis]|uniref:Uncharacterized protein n=1 Tax=Lachnellula occidentalis TaxID=215460 RepID=A0A8H8UGK2_9HELO|nr:hypothetical protein LOCC1_G003325 [Lachnellula occidentalis]
MGAISRPLQKLQSREKLSKIPNGIAFIIYRILPVGGLLLSATEGSGSVGLWAGLCLVYMSLLVAGLFAGWLTTRDSMRLDTSNTKEEWLDKLNTNIEMWIRDHNFAFGLGPRTLKREQEEVQHEKERFAICLAGSRQGIPPILRDREGSYVRILSLLVAFTSFAFVCSRPITSEEYENTWTTYLKFWTVVLLWLVFAFPLGKQFSWYCDLGNAARKIRQECKKADVENGDGNPKEQLKWWIKGILKEDSDSEALAAERMEVIIAPILRLVRCEAKSKTPVVETSEEIEAEKKADRQWRDNLIIETLKQRLEFKESLIGV